jgi:hypothetical protein
MRKTATISQPAENGVSGIGNGLGSSLSKKPRSVTVSFYSSEEFFVVIIPPSCGGQVRAFVTNKEAKALSVLTSEHSDAIKSLATFCPSLPFLVPIDTGKPRELSL